jgi:hypothetical protein
MKWLSLALLFLSACHFSTGRPYDESAAARLPLGSATTSEAKAALGAPFRASATVRSDAPTSCPAAQEVWVYEYEDLSENKCNSLLYFDESAKLCARFSTAPKRGSACSGVAP